MNAWSRGRSFPFILGFSLLFPSILQLVVIFIYAIDRIFRGISVAPILLLILLIHFLFFLVSSLIFLDVINLGLIYKLAIASLSFAFLCALILVRSDWRERLADQEKLNSARLGFLCSCVAALCYWYYIVIADGVPSRLGKPFQGGFGEGAHLVGVIIPLTLATLNTRFQSLVLEATAALTGLLTLSKGFVVLYLLSILLRARSLSSQNLLFLILSGFGVFYFFSENIYRVINRILTALDFGFSTSERFTRMGLAIENATFSFPFGYFGGMRPIWYESSIFAVFADFPLSFLVAWVLFFVFILKNKFPLGWCIFAIVVLWVSEIMYTSMSLVYLFLLQLVYEKEDPISAGAKKYYR